MKPTYEELEQQLAESHRALRAETTAHDSLKMQLEKMAAREGRPMSNIDKLKPGKYAILFRNNWDGEGDTYETFSNLDAEGIWRDEDGGELLEYQGDEVLKAWPLDDGSNLLALLDELEAAEKRIAELERKEKHIERQSVIDGLANSGEAWSDIEEYMQKWDEEHQAQIAAGTAKGE